MTAIASPTITAYKRYQVGTWAPVQIAWGVENRTALVRALPAGSSTRIENRQGSSDANPYLLAAVMIAAGLDGIRRSLDPGDPAEENLFQHFRFPRLPSSPAQGVDALVADEELTQALGPSSPAPSPRCSASTGSASSATSPTGRSTSTARCSKENRAAAVDR